MMASKLLSNGYVATPPPLKSQGVQHHQGRLLPDGFGPCAADVVGEPQQQLDRLLGAAQEGLYHQLPGGDHLRRYSSRSFLM
jgi:hypothetical protein